MINLEAARRVYYTCNIGLTKGRGSPIPGGMCVDAYRHVGAPGIALLDEIEAA